MSTEMNAGRTKAINRAGLLVLWACLAVVLGVLFGRSFDAGQALFANDGPLGVLVSQTYRVPQAFLGVWHDLYWVGFFGGNLSPNITGILLQVLGPIGFNKFSVPLSFMVLGLCAALLFRQLGFRPWVWVVAGLGAALNSNFFSNGCWGLPTRALSLAATFLALTAVYSSFKGRSIIKVLLAGVAIGLSIMEGGDNGAIFSLFVAGFAFVLSMIQPEPVPGKAAKGVARVAVMAVVAGLVAVQSLNVFVQTSFKGMAGMQQDTESKEKRWDWATQWSLPKAETLRVIIPGLFGYRMDSEAPTPSGGEYWGSVGQTPGWPQNHHDRAWVQGSMASPRFSGAGEYAGVLVVLVAIFGAVEGWRRNGKAFNPTERQLIKFWTVAAVIALLFAWGRYAPFYRIIYALPYFSTIRNPMKFMHPFHMILMILFAYGLEGLSRVYLEGAKETGASLLDQVKNWWARGTGFEKRWFWGSAAAVGVSALGFLMYSSQQKQVAAYMADNGFEATEAARAAAYSVSEVGVFVVLLVIAAGLVTLILSGAMRGARAKWAIILLGLLVAVDLGRANRPWIKYYSYKEKYASNDVLEVFRQRPYEQRVVVWPRQLRQTRELQIVGSVYDVEWLQHQFPYYNIQSIDIPQEPRMPEEKRAYLTHVGSQLARLWELTNTRYLLASTNGGLLEVLNQQLDPVKRRFRLHTLFEFTQDPQTMFISAKTNTTGPFAVIEFADPLPRAKLYSNWQVSTNGLETVKTLASPEFDPWKTVLVSDPIQPPASTGGAAPGKVELVDYAPKRVRLKTEATAPSVLLLNDKFDPGWRAEVDGKPVPVLGCNFLMRGVQVPAGTHTVEFRFQPPLTGQYVSTAGLAVGLLLCLVLVVLPGKAEDGGRRADVGGSRTEDRGRRTEDRQEKPKSEIRNPKEVRNPKSEGRQDGSKSEGRKPKSGT